MAIHFACPACEKVSKVPDEFAGRKGKCPGCNAVILVPDPNEGDSGSEAGGAPDPGDQAIGDPVGGSRIGGPRPAGKRIEGARPGRARDASAAPPGSSGYVDAREPAGETRSCPFCGEEIKRAAKKCRHCGEFIDRKLGKTLRENQFELPMSGKAIAGFVLAFLCPLIGLIVSLSAHSDCRAGKTKGGGLAIAGIILSVMNMAVGILIRTSGR